MYTDCKCYERKVWDVAREKRGGIWPNLSSKGDFRENGLLKLGCEKNLLVIWIGGEWRGTEMVYTKTRKLQQHGITKEI